MGWSWTMYFLRILFANGETVAVSTHHKYVMRQLVVTVHSRLCYMYNKIPLNWHGFEMNFCTCTRCSIGHWHFPIVSLVYIGFCACTRTHHRSRFVLIPSRTLTQTLTIRQWMMRVNWKRERTSNINKDITLVNCLDLSLMAYTLSQTNTNEKESATRGKIRAQSTTATCPCAECAH